MQRPVRRLLEPAALLRDPTVGMLEALSAEPDRVGERLDRAVAAGVIEISADSVRFVHPLLAEGMAAMIGPRRRVSCTPIWPGSWRSRSNVRGTWHWPPRGPGRVADEIEAGARAAAGRGASAAAAELLEMAASLTPGGQESDRRRRTIEAARAYKPAGLPGAGRALLESALGELPSGVQRADALLAFARAQQR